jgi:hypothetical protein
VKEGQKKEKEKRKEKTADKGGKCAIQHGAHRRAIIYRSITISNSFRTNNLVLYQREREGGKKNSPLLMRETLREASTKFKFVQKKETSESHGR